MVGLSDLIIGSFIYFHYDTVGELKIPDTANQSFF